MKKQESKVSLLRHSLDVNGTQRDENDNSVQLEEFPANEEGGHTQRSHTQASDSEFQNMTYRHKLQLQATYCANMLIMGLGIGAVGPTLWAFAFNTNSGDMGGIFTARGLGWLLGSVMSGRLLEKFPRRTHLLIFAALISMAVFLGVLPLMHDWWLVMIINVFWAVGMSMLEVGCNSLTIAVWREKLGPYMQFLHFVFGIGATLSPFLIGLLITFFRTSDVPDDIIIGGEGESETPSSDLSYKDTHEIPSALWTYWILAAISLIVAVPTVIQKSPPPLPPGQEVDAHGHGSGADNDDVEPAGNGDNSETSLDTSEEISIKISHEKIPTARQKKIRRVAVIALTATYLFLYVGAESSFGGWVCSYAIDVYGFSKPEGAYLTSAFWGALTAFRLVAVPVSIYLTPHAMLMIDMGGCMLSLVVLLAFASLKSKVVLWLMTVTFGASMASVYAAALSLPQTLNITITSKATSLLVIGSSIGDMILPMFVGWFMRLLGPQSLIWTIFGFFVAAVGIYVCLVYGMSHWFCWWCSGDAHQLQQQKKPKVRKEVAADGESEEAAALTTTPEASDVDRS